MTKLRTPDTFQDAMTKVLAQIGPAEAARVITALTKRDYSARTMREWSDPDTGTLPTLMQALALDTAHRLAGGEDAPFCDAFSQQLGIKIQQQEACRLALVADALDFIHKAGELHSALFAAAQPDSSPRDHHRALVEAQRVDGVVRRIRRRLPNFLRRTMSTGSGNTGGTHQ